MATIIGPYVVPLFPGEISFKKWFGLYLKILVGKNIQWFISIPCYNCQ
jgi:hypothetical protein